MFDPWLIATIVTKFALYLGVLAGVGTVLAAVLFGLIHYRTWAMAFAALGLSASVVGFALQGAALTGDASGMRDPEMLGLLWSTPVGTALMYRGIGLFLLSVGLFFGRLGILLSLSGGALAVFSFTVSGHVSGLESNWLGIVLFAHLLGISFWIGILTPIRRLAKNADTIVAAGEVGHRFGLLAMGVVPALVLAGVVLAWQLVTPISGIITTSYGQVLLIKIAAVTGLLALGAVNKTRFVPRLRAGDKLAAAQLAKTITFEWCVVLVILFLTAVLTTSLTFGNRVTRAV